MTDPTRPAAPPPEAEPATEPTTEPTRRSEETARGSVLTHPAFWLAAFFVLLVTMSVIFYWIAGSHPPEIIPQ